MRVRGLTVILLAALASMLFVGAPVFADTSLSKQWFDALPERERLLVQSELTWLGHYSGLIDGTFGLETYQAIVGFDALSNKEIDGVLTAEQLTEFSNRVNSELSKLGATLHKDSQTGLGYLIPKSIMTTTTAGPNGDIWTSENGDYSVASFRVLSNKTRFEQVFRNLTTQSSSRTVLQSKLTPYYFTIGGFLDGKSFYLLGFSTGHGTQGISITWPVEQKNFDRIAHGIVASLHITDGAIVRSSITSKGTVEKKPVTETGQLQSGTSVVTEDNNALSGAPQIANIPSPIKGWQDVSGLERPAIEFNADDSGCNMYARNVYLQSVNQQKQINPQGFGQNGFVTLLGIAGSYAVKKKAYTECMQQHFWVRQ